LLAGGLGVAFLLVLFGVDAVERASGRRPAARTDGATPGELRRMDFESGSMAPNLEAACRFVERTGAIAKTGALGDGPAHLGAEAGDSGRLPRKD
jgi:carbamate kinase